MNHSNEDHLLHLHAYLLKTGCDRFGMNIIKTGIMSRCRKEFMADKIDQNKICPHCFHHWSEGDFSLKFKSKNSKRKTKVQLHVLKMKCSNCGKHIKITREKLSNKSYQLSKKKRCHSTDQISQSEKGKKGQEMLKKDLWNMKNDRTLPHSQKRKKQQKNVLPKKKSNLSYMKDFL